VLTFHSFCRKRQAIRASVQLSHPVVDIGREPEYIRPITETMASSAIEPPLWTLVYTLAAEPTPTTPRGCEPQSRVIPY
jgi:hypothetical protein